MTFNFGTTKTLPTATGGGGVSKYADLWGSFPAPTSDKKTGEVDYPTYTAPVKGTTSLRKSFKKWKAKQLEADPKAKLPELIFSQNKKDGEIVSVTIIRKA